MRRSVARWALLPALLLAVASCGGGDADDQPTSAEDEGQNGGTEDEGAPLADSIAVAVWTGPEAEALRVVAPMFTDATGIAVEIDEVSRDAYRTRASTIVMGGQAAWDTFWAEGQWIPEFVAAGALEPLDEPLADQIGSLGGVEHLTFDGSLYGLPTEYHSQYLYYRADLFDELGLEVPETWDEYLEVMQALTDPAADRYGGVSRGGGGGGNLGIHFDFSNYFLGFGAEFLDDQGRPALNSPEGVAALEFFNSLLQEHEVVPPDASAIGYLEKNQYFQGGNVATMIQWTAAYEEIFNCEISPDVCEVTEFAMLPGRDVGGQVERGALASINGWVVPQSSERKEAAFEFLRWLAGDEGAKAWALNGGTPSNQNTLDDPEVLEARPDYAVLAETLPFTSVVPLVPESTELLGVWAEQLALSLQGEMTAQEAMDNIAAEWERILEEGGHL